MTHGPMPSATEKQKLLTGGCQCGAVRFVATPPLGEVTLCYCRMCQKATGGPLAYYVRVENDAPFRWTRGEPRRFASSNVARRGFCGECGTPLTWEFDAFFEVTVAAFDNPAHFEPEIQMSVQSRAPWLTRINDLPVRTLDSDPEYAEFIKSVVSYQHPDHDTARWPPQDRNG